MTGILSESDRDRWQIEVLRQLERAGRYQEWQVSMVIPDPGRKILELGCGIGVLTRKMAKTGGAVTAVDQSEESMAALMRSLDASDDVRPVTGRLEDSATWASIGGDYDTILAFNVLEHVSDDRELLTRARRAAARGGRLRILVPACPFLFGSADLIAGHRRRYELRAMRRLLEETGWEPRFLRYFNVIGALGWWWRFKIRRKGLFSSDEIGIMDRLTPLMRRVESLVPPPFGISLCVHAVKP